ncbi:outer membrane lipoprotein-sorting protein [Gracilinema caldarium]|uniref:outer membrane lipoprotein-sorting protein n=1 Tax=Gracilinema caldarium TaxID=215591 RepID=UPI0026EE2B37|nr:outer membrane lipoprotein-sorting protein [Gracilinema caldarium]
MKRLIWLLMFTMTTFGLVFSQSVTAFDVKKYQSLLATVDRELSVLDTDFSAEYVIQKRDPGGAVSSTRATIFRRDAKNQFLVLILEPTIDKGKGYLKLGDNLWLYDPVGKTFTFTNARDRFQNSSFKNSDFEPSHLSRDYKPLSAERTKLGSYDCTLLELEAVSRDAAYPKMKIWISSDNLVRKREEYSLSGSILRTVAIPSYQKVEKKWLPASMIIIDHLQFKSINGKVEYERTTVTVSKPSLKSLPDTVYTKDYLERVAR